MKRALIEALRGLERSSGLTSEEQATAREARELLNRIENDLLAAAAHLELEDFGQALAVVRTALGLPSQAPAKTPTVHETILSAPAEVAREKDRSGRVVDMLPALRARQQARDAQLYQQILDSVSHLTD